MNSRILTALLFCMGLISCNPANHKPLTVSSINPRFFQDENGKAIYLTGSHTWNNLVDMAYGEKTDTFNYQAYLNFLKKYNHNFFRLWTWELMNWDTHGNEDENAKSYRVGPHIWLRTGPGEAVDGLPKFDLSQFNEEYFNRLRNRVNEARKQGCYVSVMLFEGWGIQFSPDAYRNHPYFPWNNINNLGLDTAQASRLEIHELKHKNILAIQEAYLIKLMETVKDLDNVLYEISNENHPASTEWQYHIIRFIKDYESKSGHQHPVGITFQYEGGSNQVLFDSPADWISPNNEGGYREDPPASEGKKVIINDTDHLWGIGGNVDWVWKSFTRGMNVLFMDPYDGRVLMQSFDTVWAESVRKNMGYTLDYSRKMDLIHMIPSNDLSTTRYCLANQGMEYLVYFPKDSTAEVDLSMGPGKFNVEWLDPVSGSITKGEAVDGGEKQMFTPPFNSTSAVLYLKIEK